MKREFIAYITREESCVDDLFKGESGLYPDPNHILKTYCSRIHKYKLREKLEEDDSKKQLIPYTVLRNRDGEIFVTERLEGSGEERLHNQLSIGVGGHLDISMTSINKDPIRAGAYAELNEELCISGLTPSIRYVGILSDDNNDVGRVHLGFVYAGQVFAGSVEVKETEKLRGFWEQPQNIDRERLESWSKILLDNLSTVFPDYPYCGA